MNNETEYNGEPIAELEDVCALCRDSVSVLIPMAGSGTNSTLVCPKCIRNRRLQVLDEYEEKIDEFLGVNNNDG